MAKLGEIVKKVRSKNAGPFWLTIDIFCGDDAVFKRVCNGLTTNQLATVFHVDEACLKRFEIPELNVVKFSLPRPSPQGAANDRDMHGASWAALIAESVEIN